MRTINLPPPAAPPTSPDECVSLYLHRLEVGAMPFWGASQLLVALMAWPNDEATRNTWMATNAALFVDRDDGVSAASGKDRAPDNSAEGPPSPDQVAFEAFGGLRSVTDAALLHLHGQLDDIQMRWIRVADILHVVVDMAYDTRVQIRGGTSVSKAVELLECHRALPAKSQLRADWSRFRDVAHLITAAAHIACEGAERTRDRTTLAILTPILLAPEAVLSIALGFQEFGLTTKPYRQTTSLLPTDTLWRVPRSAGPENLFLPFRRLTDAQIDFLAARRARSK